MWFVFAIFIHHFAKYSAFLYHDIPYVYVAISWLSWDLYHNIFVYYSYHGNTNTYGREAAFKA